MQNRYTGDIGDFAKYALLRALGEDHRLGVAWYLFPDESHNTDGKHTDYLMQPDKWRPLDPELFDGLRSLVTSNQRNVYQVETSGLLDKAQFSNELLAFDGDPATRGKKRAAWFSKTLFDLRDCDLVFADPDNGLCLDQKYSMASKTFWKRMPLSEAHVLAAGRTAIIYHHNTRRAGGHAREIQYWLEQFGQKALALYWRHLSNRTFFIIHPTSEIRLRAEKLAQRWSPWFELHTKNGDHEGKCCPECGHQFRGKGWGGIDAHWKAHHEDIMPYTEAWPLIKQGKIPSVVMKHETQCS
jgi:hypothetical protein